MERGSKNTTYLEAIFWGGRPDSNRQPSGPQPDAPPLSYDHHAQSALTAYSLLLKEQGVRNKCSIPHSGIELSPGRIERPTYSLEGCCSIQLSYGDKWKERAMGFEPTTPCLEGRSSTAELHPLTADSLWLIAPK